MNKAVLETTTAARPLDRDRPHPSPAPGKDREGGATRYLLAAARLSLGWLFLWAFLDKAFGWGRSTAAGKGWIDGGSPTAGFLGHAATGPFRGRYGDIAGAGWADGLFMLGLLGIGAALLLGVAMRIASVAGALLLVLMWTVVLPPVNNPFMDDHLIYALLLGVLCLTHAGRTVGLGRRWEQLAFVRKYPALV